MAMLSLSGQLSGPKIQNFTGYFAYVVGYFEYSHL